MMDAKGWRKNIKPIWQPKNIGVVSNAVFSAK